MNRKLLLLAALPLAIAFAACGDNKTYCWVCTTDTTYNSGGYMGQATQSGHYTVCDKTKKQIRDVEANGSILFNDKSTITTCQKK